MLRRIPAAGREIETSGEGHGIVDDDDLLMMAGEARMAVVEVQVQSWVSQQSQALPPRLAVGSIERDEVPGEEIDVQLGVALERG